jgi:hypothetical protein
MRVSFTCEKCGYDYGESVVVEDGLDLLIPHGTRLPMKRTCPNCAKLTYGPLTEEGLIEALKQAGRVADAHKGDCYRAEARFVLRLLKAVESDGLYRSGWGAEDRREWLLDLAREP